MKTYIVVILVLCMSLPLISAEPMTKESAATPPSASTIKLKPSILGKRKPETKSDRSILEIEKVVVSFIMGGRNIADKNVQDAIIQQVKSMFPVDESAQVEDVNLMVIERKATLEAKIKYPFTRKDLKKKYSREAKEKFKAQSLNAELTVKYQQGPNAYQVSGIYYGLTQNHDGICIGKTIVPMIDLLPESKVKFDTSYRKKQRQDFIKRSIAKDLSLRDDYISRKVAEAVGNIIKRDESAGYILSWNKWRTPEEVAKIILKYYSQ